MTFGDEVAVRKLSPLTYKVVTALKILESNGNYALEGKSGEYGAYQFLPRTFHNYQKIYMGTTTSMTPEYQDEVAELYVNDMVEKGYSVYQIGLIHNQGHIGKCIKGINQYGVKYDSCWYAQKLQSMVNLSID